MQHIPDENIPQHPVNDVWAINRRLGSVVQADCYQAERLEDKEDVLLWFSRNALGEREQEQFLEHLKCLMSVQDWGEVEFGVDATNRAYVALNCSSTRAIDFDAPGTITMRNRFLMCAMHIAQIHDAGFACGNITPGCFVVDSFGAVRMIGFMGGYDDRVSATVSSDIRPFSIINKDAAGVPSAIADVYSLAVMGLALFGAKFPPEPIDLRRLDAYLERVNSDAPPWVLSVLAMIVREPQKRFCADARAFLSAISVTDREYLAALVNNTDEQLIDAAREKPLSIDEIRDICMTTKQIRMRRVNTFVRSRMAGWIICGLILSAALLVVILQASNLRGLIPNRIAAGSINEDSDPTLQDVKSALALLKGGGDSIGVSANNEVGSGAVINNNQMVEPMAMRGASVRGVVSIAKKISIEADSIIFEQFASGKISSEERTILFGLYAECDDESKSRLAGLVAKIGSELEREFRNLLMTHLHPSVITDRESANKLSTDALFLAAEGRLSKRAAEVWGRLDLVSNDELWWLLKLHAMKRSPVFSVLSREVLRRHITTPENEIFFSVAAVADAHSGAPYDVLFRAGTGIATKSRSASDVQLLITWADPLAATALFAVLMSQPDPEIIASAISGIPSKSGVISLVVDVIDILISSEGYEPARVGKFIGALGLADSICEETLVQGLATLNGNKAQRLVVPLVLEKGTPKVVKAALRAFGRDIHPDMLIHLLNRPEAGVRKTVIPFLKEVSIASSKARIRERYDAELDPEVRRVFEVELDRALLVSSP